jgi:hypothetical protein
MILLILSVLVTTHVVQLSETNNYLDNRVSISTSQLGNPDKDGFFEIKYEELLKQKNKCYLSQIATDVKYIQLETHENCIVCASAKYYFSDSLIFINNKDHVLEYSNTGRFIRQIGKAGRGPGEINSIRMISILPDQRMIVLHDGILDKMIYYSFDGTFIKTITASNHKYTKVMDNGMYISYELEYGKSEENYFSLTSETGNIISYVKNYKKWSNPSALPTISLSMGYEPFYSYQNKYYFKTMFNDTVYTVKGNKIIPEYFINLGKFKLPEEKQPERVNNQKSGIFLAPGYYYARVFEAGEKIFLNTICFCKDPSNLFMIDKSNFDRKTDPSYDGTTKGYVLNDWDGGMFFWPDGNINDSQIFMPIDIIHLKEYFDLIKSQKISVKYPDKQKVLENIVSKANIQDNPILMIVTLKP